MSEGGGTYGCSAEGREITIVLGFAFFLRIFVSDDGCGLCKNFDDFPFPICCLYVMGLGDDPTCVSLVKRPACAEDDPVGFHCNVDCARVFVDPCMRDRTF